MIRFLAKTSGNLSGQKKSWLFMNSVVNSLDHAEMTDSRPWNCCLSSAILPRDKLLENSETSIWRKQMANVRSAAVTLKGNAVDLAGPELKVGDAVPDFELQNNGLGDVTLADSAGKKRIVITVPSLDTPTCHQETKRFNHEAGNLADVEILVVSMDLPFAQKRWCGAESAENIKALSGHRCTGFGEAYGVLIQGGPLHRCLARAVFVADVEGKLTHVEYVSEIADHPNYDAALAAVQ
jgi:thioredoxin-dependent peroxiredoxin